MLQQTRVEAVKRYYARFMEALPNVNALANVGRRQALKIMEGLDITTVSGICKKQPDRSW